MTTIEYSWNLIPQQCRHCKKLETCRDAYVNEYRDSKVAAEAWARNWGFTNKCEHFEWEDKLTRYDFMEKLNSLGLAGEIQLKQKDNVNLLPERCKQCARFHQKYSCRTIYESYGFQHWADWLKTCDDLRLFIWNTKLTKYDFRQ